MSIEIKVIELENGFFIKSSISLISSLIMNDGMKYQTTYANKWLFVPRKLTNLKKVIKGKRINERFELKNPEMQSDHIPLLMPKDEVMCCNCESYFCGCNWKDDYSHLRSLYKEAYEFEEDTFEEIEFDWSVVGKSNKSFSNETFCITNEGGYQNDYRPSKGEVVNWFKYKNVEDQILYPSVLKSTLPCKLTKSQWYNVIRNHIKVYIDNRYAYISSDYDFCLTVQKRVVRSINEIVSEGNKKTYKEKDIQIFECAPKAYQKYSVVGEIEGDDYADLIVKIKKYLHELMLKINTPTYKCDCCNGYGYIVKK